MGDGQRLRRIGGQLSGSALIVGKAVVQQRAGSLETLLARGRPQHNGNQPQAVALGTGGDADACLAGGAGLQPRDAGVAFQQFVGVDQLCCAAAQSIHPDGAVVPHLGMMQENFAAHEGHIPG